MLTLIFIYNYLYYIYIIYISLNVDTHISKKISLKSIEVLYFHRTSANLVLVNGSQGSISPTTITHFYIDI